MTAPAQSTASAPFDVHALREREFPFVGRAPYLNAASVGPLPQRARSAIDQANHRRSSIHNLRGADFEPVLQRARAAAARLVGAGADEIALMPNTTFGINFAAHALPIESGRRIVLSALEFPANVYPWLALERFGGAKVTIVPADPLGRPDEDRILEELDRGDVGIFALSAVQFATGYAADLPKLGRFCCERGIWFVVDAIQALGCVPLDARAAEIDILATGAQKWLCGPWGTGFAYVRRELVPRLEPRVVGWTAMAASADLEDCCGYRWELAETASRFEVSTQPWHDYAGFAESLGLLAEIGVERIREHVLGLLDPVIDWLQRQDDAEIVSDLHPARRSGVFSFRLGDTTAAYRALRRAGVQCTLREGGIRLAPHLYNTAEEMETVIGVLARRDAW